MYWQRLLFTTSLAIVEVAPAALLVTMAGRNVWALLLAVALLGALVGRLTERWLPEHIERPALFAIGLLLGMLAFVGVSSSGWNLFAAITQAEGSAYIALLATLYVFWRGTLLAEHDSVTVGRFFNRAVVVMVVLLALGALGNALGSELAATAGWELLSFFGFGLLAIALAHTTSNEGGMRQIDWRGVATLLATIAVVIIGAVVAVSLFGGALLPFVTTLAQAVALVVVLVLAPFAFVLEWLINQFITVFGNSALTRILAQQAQQFAETNRQLQQTSQTPPWLGVVLNIFCFVVPLALLAAIILLRRRRARANKLENERRESLLSWAAISSDLRDLFGGFGRRSDAGLRGALARLTGKDPASRIRRAYIRLLLHAEARERARAASQTPHEFAPAAASVTNAYQPVETLTNAYERARYAPTTASETEAKQAEQAWKQIENNP